jgi:hypothetical protein
MKPRFKLLFIGIALVGATAAGNAATLLTFDDLPAGGPSDFDPPVVPDGYGGLNWDNFAVVNGLEFGATTGEGYYYGVVSSPNVAFNDYGDPASLAVSSGLFDLDSGYLTSALNSFPTLNIQVQGFVGATMLYNNTYTVNNSGPTLINFDYAGVDSVTFTAGDEEPSWFVMDNLTVTVPEPRTYALMSMAVVLAGFNVRRRKFESGFSRDRIGG